MSQPKMKLKDVCDEWLKTWVDAGYMTAEEYNKEMQRRKLEPEGKT